MSKNNFFIVGIGSSAGGQKALEDFFSGITPDLAAAFVVVTHLNRTYRSSLAHIISRFSSLEVTRVNGCMRVERGNIYVMPENVIMKIKNGMLHLEQRSPSDIVNHTVDIFFESLARDCGPKAIGVILAGMGSDGAKGALKIHENGGEIFVQEPASTAFDAMPEATIIKDHPNCILPPEALGSTLAETILRRQRKFA